MKKLFAPICAAACLAAATGCGVHISGNSSNWSDGDLKAVTNVTQNAEISAGLKNLEVENPIGSIHITGTDNTPARWTWKLTVRARTDAIAQQIASNINCKTELEGGRLKLTVLAPESTEPHSIQSDFEITVPKSTGARTQTRFGRTDIANLAGEVEAIGQNGEMEIRHIGGRVRARTSFARLSVSDTGPAILKNQNGEIEVTRVGGSLEAATSFAPLIAQDVRGPASLANQNGDLKATAIGGLLGANTSFASLVARDIHGPASLTNQNGQIEADDIAEALDAKTSFASISAHNIGGPVHLRDQMGGIHVAQARGNADIKTSFDQLSVEGIQGDAVLMNQNGGVAASGVTGSVKANTSFATIEITGSGPEFVCHNQNGNIRLRATSATITNIEASTSFATLELHLPAGLKPAILARTTFGDIESDFPVLMKPRGADAFADIAPGLLRASLQNQNGNIRVIRD